MILKISLIFSLLFLYCSNSFAISKKDEKQNEAAFKSILESLNYAEAKLPPCEGLDRAFDELTKYSAPKSCPKSHQFYSLVEKRVRILRDNCRDMSRWIEETLRSPSLCYMAEDSSRRNNILKQLGSFKYQLFNEDQENAENKILEDPEFRNFDNLNKVTKGEFARNECVLPMHVSLQMRKKTLTLANKHYGVASQALETACDATENGKENYFNFLRGGEEAMENSN